MRESEPVQKELSDVKHSQGDYGQHTFTIKRFTTGEVVGSAAIEEVAEPKPHYLIDSLDVNEDEQGRGFASQLMSAVERFSRQNGRPVLLYDATSDEGVHYEQNAKSIGMYGKRAGWVPVMSNKGPTGYYVFGSDEDPIALFRYLSSYGHDDPNE